MRMQHHVLRWPIHTSALCSPHQSQYPAKLQRSLPVADPLCLLQMLQATDAQSHGSSLATHELAAAAGHAQPLLGCSHC